MNHKMTVKFTPNQWDALCAILSERQKEIRERTGQRAVNEVAIIDEILFAMVKAEVNCQ